MGKEKAQRVWNDGHREACEVAGEQNYLRAHTGEHTLKKASDTPFGTVTPK